MLFDYQNVASDKMVHIPDAIFKEPFM